MNEAQIQVAFVLQRARFINGNILDFLLRFVDAFFVARALDARVTLALTH